MAIYNDILRTLQPGRAEEADRAAQNNSLRQQLELLRSAGGPETPAGAEIFNQIQQHPAYQQLSQRIGKTFSVKDFQASDPALQIRQQAVDAQKEVARARQIRELSDAMVNLKDSYRTVKGDYEGLEADESYKQMARMLGQLLAGTPQEPPQPQAGQPLRTADLFVSPKDMPAKARADQQYVQEKWGPRFEAANQFMGKKVAETGEPETKTETANSIKQSELARQAPMIENWWLSGWKGMGTTGKGPASGTEEGGSLDPLTELADQFVDAQSTRKQALSEGKAVVPNAIDPTDTTPKRMADVGIHDPDQQREFSDLESMVQKALPDVDLRATYQHYPQAFSKLLAAIRNGVPDNKGGTRKLSMKEIVQAIKSMGY